LGPELELEWEDKFLVGLGDLLDLLDQRDQPHLDRHLALVDPGFLENLQDPMDPLDLPNLRDPIGLYFQVCLGHLEAPHSLVCLVDLRDLLVHKHPLCLVDRRGLLDLLNLVGLVRLQVQLHPLLPLDLEHPRYLVAHSHQEFQLFLVVLPFLVVLVVLARQAFRQTQAAHSYQERHSNLCPLSHQLYLARQPDLLVQKHRELLVVLDFQDFLLDQQGQQGRHRLLDQQDQQDQRDQRGLEDLEDLVGKKEPRCKEPG